MRSTCDKNILRQQYLVNPILSKSQPKSQFYSTLDIQFLNYYHLCAITFPQLKQRTGIIISPIFIIQLLFILLSFIHIYLCFFIYFIISFIFCTRQYDVVIKMRDQHIYKIFLNISLSAMYMYPYRDTEDQGLLDKLQSQKKQLIINLGRVKDEATQKKIIQQLQRVLKQQNKLLPYELYDKLKQQQTQMRLLLQKIDKKQQTIKKTHQLSKNEYEHLQKIRNNALLIVIKIKQQQAEKDKCLKLAKQIKEGNDIIKKLQITNFEVQMKFIDDVIKQLQHKNKALNEKLVNTKNAIQSLGQQKMLEMKRWENLLTKRATVEKQLNLEKATKITEGMAYKKLKNQGQSSQILNCSNSERQSFQRRQVSEPPKKITIKQKQPVWYWIWVLILIIWTIILFFMKNKKQINQVSENDYCY